MCYRIKFFKDQELIKDQNKNKIIIPEKVDSVWYS